MRIDDLRRFRPNTQFDCDVCIVGGGPAGLTIATELANTALRVLVVESGDKSREQAFADSLSQIESVGAPREMQQRHVRNRVLGGSSHTWFGRCTALDTIDYEYRPWIEHSGWPVSEKQLLPYLERARSYLGLRSLLNLDELQTRLGLADALNPDDLQELRMVAWQFSSRSVIHHDYVRFGARFRALQARNVKVLIHATVTELRSTAISHRISSLQLKSSTGLSHSISAHSVILCGGGIENARLLLASNRMESAGVGNRHGQVGRFLMDHPRTTVGCFAANDAPRVQQELGLFHGASGARFQRGLSLSVRAQRQEGLLNCVAWTTQHVAEDDAWRLLRTAILRKGSERLRAAIALCRHTDQIADGLLRKLMLRKALHRRLERLDLDVMVEQLPDPESRIRLSSRRDALDQPISVIDWKISDLERQTVIRLAHAVNASLAQAGLPQAKLVNWVRHKRATDAIFSDPAHPIGATRMAVRPEDGVVDANGKVFGIENLYIAGSSTFPTGGHANPTLTIVALSLRLADHLQAIVPAATAHTTCPLAVSVAS